MKYRIFIFVLLILLTVQPTTSRAGVAEALQSLQGSGIANGVTLKNNEVLYLSSITPTPLVNSSKASVVLRFDDSKRNYYSAYWRILVDYDITLYDISGSSTVVSGEGLEITFDPANPYNDRAVKQYNAHKADITITGVQYLNSLGNPISAPLPVDVYLDNLIVTERYFSLASVAAPAITHNTTVTNNELEVYWNYTQGAESYDLEWLFLDIPDVTDPASYDYDFKNATRVNVTGNSYRIPLAYPQGVILYRVRGVGFDISNFPIRMETPWSTLSNTGTVDPTAITIADDAYVITNGLNSDMNWQYSASYAEDGKRKEVVSYFDGSLRSRQQLTLLNTDNNAIIAETKYDYEGRGSVQILPAPITSTGIKYYNNFNPNFDRNNFDGDAMIESPDPMGTVSGAGNYYSPSNPDKTGMKAYTPDAEGYPYSQVRYMNDGTGRIRSQSGVGPNHKLGSTHETQYFYGTPTSQEELDRLFGNEVGLMKHYKKNMVMDANGQVSVSYIDEHGRTIATALAGNPGYNDGTLLPIDNKYPGVQTFTTSLLGNTTRTLNDEEVSVNTITISKPNSQYNYVYSLAATTSCSTCLPTGSQCVDCKYDVEISILDQDGNYFSGLTPDNPVLFSNITYTTSVNFSVTFPVGVFTVIKKTKLNEASLESYRQSFIAQQLDEENENRCVTFPVITPSGCDDCETSCEESYIKRDSTGAFVCFIDDADTCIGTNFNDPPDAWEQLVSACKESVCSPYPDPCEIRLKNITADMSPGGQYFDNTVDEFTQDVNGEYHRNGSYDNNEWLDANINTTIYPTFWTDFENYFNTIDYCPHPSFTVTANQNWNTVRTTWQDCYAGFLIRYHPEYCAYSFFCIGQCDAPNGYAAQFAYEKRMAYSEGAGSDDELFNPLSLSQNTTLGNPQDDNSDYQPYLDEGIDPYFSAECQQEFCECPGIGSQTKNTVAEQFLKHFLHIGGGNFHSIWYALENPAGISSTNLYGMPAYVGEVYDGLADLKNIHGETNFSIFRNYYRFVKEVIKGKEYDLYANNTNNPGGGAPPCVYTTTATPLYQRGYLATATNKGPLDAEGHVVYFPENPVIAKYVELICHEGATVCEGDIAESFNWCEQEQYDTTFLKIALNCFNTKVTNAYTENCDDICSNNVTLWAKNAASCLDVDQYATIVYYLNKVCKQSCLENNIHGLDTCSGVAGEGSHSAETFYSFGDVTTYFYEVYGLESCPPVRSNDYTQGNCSCGNITDLISELGVTEPYDASEQAKIVEAVNDAVQPASPYTFSQIEDWLTECNKFQPSLSTLTLTLSYPASFVCPENPIGTSTLTFAQLAAADCEAENLALDSVNAKRIFDKQLEQLANNYIKTVKENCLNSLETNEVFNLVYSLDEYYYTLYYYDQAGNLIKTVPPNGIKVLTYVDDPCDGNTSCTNTLNAVAAYRSSNGTNGCFVSPCHTYVTHYQYNSLNQLIEQTTPDAGKTIFFYDAVSRLVASQNAKQITYSPQGYSYTRYDALSRIYEVGQKQSSTALTDAIASNINNSFDNWLVIGGNRTEVTKTFYDEYLSTTVNGYFGIAGQENLRNRVGTASYQDVYTISNTTYDHATHYSYDVHGNVKTLIQENTTLNSIGQDIKKVNYEYDLVSGNVNAVHYQSSETDQYHHYYDYDADNRITNVYTSNVSSSSPSQTGVSRTMSSADAKYFYYPHGPLGRMETGDKQVHGCDYAYTIQGWIKGVNSNTLKENRDIGKDGNNSLSYSTLHTNFARDAFGYTLGYFAFDYKGINNPSLTNHFEASTTNAINFFTVAAPFLYNGNISHMVTAQLNTDESPLTVHGSAYKYDQLNRLKEANVFTSPTIVSSNQWDFSATNDGSYHEEYTYDLNGNILSLLRKGDNNTNMDNLKYFFWNQDGTASFDPTVSVPVDASNKLAYVDDAITSIYNVDIDDQVTDNYTYDKIGNLESDTQEEIDHIDWTVYGKLWKITRTTNNHNKPDMEFAYDASGNRIMKVVKPRVAGVLQPSSTWVYTYYVRDAQGNILATYYKDTRSDQFCGSYTYMSLTEHDIYGSSRLGTDNKEVTLVSCILPFPDPFYRRHLGYKQYELTSHLGNVLVTTSDRKLAVQLGTTGTVDYYNADVVSSQSYYSFGFEQPNYGNPYNNTYRYGFNGKEKVDEMHGVSGSSYDYGMRTYDSRLGRFISVDPIAKKYPHLTPYQYASNTPIQAIDLDGLEAIKHEVAMWRNSEGETQFNVKTSYDFEGDDQRVQYSIHNLDNGSTQDIWVNPTEITYEPSAFELVMAGADYVGDKVYAGLQAADRFNASIKGSSYGEGEDWIESFGVRFKGGVEFQQYKYQFEAGLYSTQENNVGAYFNLSKRTGFEVSVITGRNNLQGLKVVPNLSVGFGANSSNLFDPKYNGLTTSFYGQLQATASTGLLQARNRTKYNFLDGKISNTFEGDYNFVPTTPGVDVRVGTFFEVKFQQSTGTINLSGGN